MKQNEGKILIIQGAQYGSEGKGQVAALLAASEANMAVRTGSINAGHTVWYDDGNGNKPYSMQQIPTAWVVPNIPLIIGAGAFIHPEILLREIAMVSAALGQDIRHRLYIDKRCSLHTKQAEEAASLADRHHKMGATGKGSSEALKMKLDARGDFDLARSLLFANNNQDPKLNITDTTALLNEFYDAGATILLEGTQGSLLDLNLGEHPFVTNRGCNAATWLAECGLSPALNVEVVLVARTYPIRVAGNSGGMGTEVSWEWMWERWNKESDKGDLVPLAAINAYREAKDQLFEDKLDKLEIEGLEFWNNTLRRIQFRPENWTQDQKERYSGILADVPSEAFKSLAPEHLEALTPYIEKTTVTKKPRRIAKFDHDEFARAVAWNRPERVFLGFANYVDPNLWNVDLTHTVLDSVLFMNMKREIEALHNIKICGTSTGAQPKYHLFW